MRDLKTALSKAAEWGIIESSPLAGMKQVKADKNGRVRYLSEAEEKRLRAALDARQEKQRIERRQHNQWRHERRMEPLPLMDGRYTDYLEPLVVLAMMCVDFMVRVVAGSLYTVNAQRKPSAEGERSMRLFAKRGRCWMMCLSDV